MVSSCHFTLAFFLLVAWVVCDITNYDILDFELKRRHHEWMVEHGRVYKDESERAQRFEIFKENVKYVEEFNSAGTNTYTLGVNQFADLTMEEFRAKYISDISIRGDDELAKPSASSGHGSQSRPSVSVPASVDWRTEGAVTYVRHQGDCESCWAIVAAEAVEGIYRIKRGILYNLSAQQLNDCDKNNGGCNKGYIEIGLEYVERKRGLTTEENYPYTGVNGTCNHTKEGEAVADINGHEMVRRNREVELAEAVARQPVGAGVDAFSKDWLFYKSGIFRGNCTVAINHAVLIVGYGTENETNYWILKNSWGAEWGDGGYMKLLKDDIWAFWGTCGIASYACYPTID